MGIVPWPVQGLVRLPTVKVLKAAMEGILQEKQ